MEEKLQKLKSLQMQMITLRNDSSLLTGITFNTLAGDIHIEKKGTAISLLDCFIKDLKEEIDYLEK